MTAAIYCRLSKEDREERNAENPESESIQNQKSLLVRYAVERGWDVYSLYCDEDYSGADRDRPDFCRLLSDAEKGRFDVVLVKTQSRFTRDMELVEKYIHGKFVEWGIRFVAVVDNVDTDVRGNKKARQINGLINEWYLEDLSENIRAVLDNKRHRGQYVGGFPLYGYRKAPGDKNRLIVDPPAAAVVRRIFSLYLAGSGTQRIARLLNEEGVPNPTKYKQLQGLDYVNGRQTTDRGTWSRTTVGRILTERTYAGDLAQGRRRKLSYKSKKSVSLPPEEWVVVEDAHEPIVDRETFTRAAALLQGHRRGGGGGGEAHPLAGLVRCMDCGAAMVKTSTVYRGVRRSYLRCSLHARDPRACTGHAVRLDRLEAAVRVPFWRRIEELFDPAAAERSLAVRSGVSEGSVWEKECARLTGEIGRRETAMRELYLDKAAGLLTAEQFAAWSGDYRREIGYLKGQRDLAEQRRSAAERENGEPLRERIARELDRKTLPRALLAAMIERIEVGERDPETGRQALTIRWRR